MAKASEAQLRANAKYKAENTFRIAIQLNRKTETDIIGRLEKAESKAGYIKRLIREDIAREKEGEA